MEKVPLFDLVDSLLSPVSTNEPTGQSIRYDPVMSEIRVAREADDPSLPQGEWERPLKKADWPLVARLCQQALVHSSKDLQLAAWLTEAWTQLHALDGFRAGIRLVHGLLQTYWDGVHPQQDEDGDYDGRAATLTWMNETLPLTLRLHVALRPWPDRKPPFITLEDWTKAPLVTPPAQEENDQNGPNLTAIPSREELMRPDVVTGSQLIQLRSSVEACLKEWQQLDELVESRMGNQSPSLSRVVDTLNLMNRAIQSLLTHRQNTPAPAALIAAEPQLQTETPQTTPDRSAPDADNLNPVSALPVTGFLETGPIRSRAEAYRLLENVADYLLLVEPHSPTPYLVRRAVSWGRMPLPELMQEVLREEGDLNRLFKVWGLKTES
jgi:type VI secretion system protein ImpA